MRRLKRYFRRLISEWKNRGRRTAVTAELSKCFAEPVFLRPSGSRGADSIYQILTKGGDTLGVLRLLNPYRKEKVAADMMPYRILSGKERIERERNAYQICADSGVTPEVLLTGEDFIACRYFNGKPILSYYLNNQITAIDMVRKGWRILHDLHQLDVSHMDASVQNLLLANTKTSAILVDFEFGASADVTTKTQFLYDFLRYLESALKFFSIEDERLLATEIYEHQMLPLAVFEDTSLERLVPALERLSRSEHLWPLILTMHKGST